MATLSRFVLARGDRGQPYFQCLKSNNRFVRRNECEESFLKLKEYLASPPVLCKPLPITPLRLYFAITERAISSIIVQEQDRVQRPIYCCCSSHARNHVFYICLKMHQDNHVLLLFTARNPAYTGRS